MEKQNLIRRALSSPAGFDRLAGILEEETFESRSAAVRRVCEAFGFFDARGRPQISGCLSALAAMERGGRVSLPPASKRVRPSGPAMLGHPVPDPSGVPGAAGLAEGFELVPVLDLGARRIFNEMMEREHPLGARNQYGRQLRYLFGSAHGWLGGAHFASPALAVAARDAWIGWNAAAREERLHLVVGLARFLIRPQVRCRNLASMALAACMRRLAEDFEALHGIRPALAETFIGPEHRGSCFLACGWTRVGETTGRGRVSAPGPAKSVLALPLADDWRARLGAEPEPPAPLGPAEGLDSSNWAEHEFGGAPLGDARLTKRLVRSAAIQARSPGRSFFGAAAGSEADVSGYYRMIEHPNAEAVSVEAILATHRRRTLERMAGQSTVLLIQDGCDLNFATRPGCRGLGLIAKNRKSSGTLGLHMHSTYAVGGDGIPLGAPRIEFDARSAREEGGDVPEEERKTQRWVRGLRDSAELAAPLEGVRTVAVMDREGDAVEVFAERRSLGDGIDLLVRARHDRSLGKKKYSLFERMRRAPARGRVSVRVERASSRNSARGSTERKARAPREAACALRWKTLEIPVPERKRGRFGAEPFRLTAVHAAEEADPADGSERLEWLLLTTLPVAGEEQAREALELYALRWRIEDWHRILKSGCKVEEIAHAAAERIQRAAAINAVIAWRLAALTLCGRETPELDAKSFFTDIEIAVLADFAKERRFRGPENLGRAMSLVAAMGGHLHRKHDRPPGNEVVWFGYARLADSSAAAERARRLGPESEIYKLLRPD